MARGGSRLGGDALLRKTFKKKRKKGRKKKKRKKERGKISHLFSVSGRDTEEERLVLYIYIYIYLYLYLYLYMYTQPRHYGVLDASCTVCGQTKADNAH